MGLASWNTCRVAARRADFVIRIFAERMGHRKLFQAILLQEVCSWYSLAGVMVATPKDRWTMFAAPECDCAIVLNKEAT